MLKISNAKYQELRNAIWADMVSSGVTTDEDENYQAFDSIFGNNLNVNWDDDNSFNIELAGCFLYGENEKEIRTMVEIIMEHEAKGLGTDMIDHIDGVQVVEQFEFTFTCSDFLKHIS